jgi:pimeloyl-ACP methyl ester carboxylesterase
MSRATHLTTGLAYDDVGTGTPVVFLHGLTFDRRTWQPIVVRLDGSVRSIAIDLPAHGESAGVPAPHDEIAASEKYGERSRTASASNASASPCARSCSRRTR